MFPRRHSEQLEANTGVPPGTSIEFGVASIGQSRAAKGDAGGVRPTFTDREE